MKFVTFEHTGRAEVGLVEPAAGRVWPLAAMAPEFDGDMVALIQRYESLKDRIRPHDAGLALADVTLRAPIPRPPRNVFCVGKNYREHAREFTQSGFDATGKCGDTVPNHPIIFTKAPSTVIGPGDGVRCHAGLTEQLDYEAELAVVIGKGGYAIPRADAEAHVWGYTIANDITARDLQLRHRQWFLGKSLDTSCPMGPWIATADELDAGSLSIHCWVNGELRQHANTSELIFDIPTLIETISAGLTLEPGDIISTGTPAGVGVGFDPPRFLKHADTVKIEIEGLGSLINRVI
jgi:2-keto-4-pentenoate hydratase/2-oxohepta-3-ene-1,7-dioic acid hydratase in catechol pathway